MSFKLSHMARAGLLCAVLCVLSPLSIPIGPIPVTLGTLGVYFCGLFCKQNEGITALLLYIFAGCMGLPVFSGFRGGLSVLIGPTGGFILGYIPLILVLLLLRKFPLLGIFLGTLVCYLTGTAWYVYETNCGLLSGVLCCVYPFLPGDLVKGTVSYLIFKKSTALKSRV